jgi:sugar lactone lactonase YvrE
MAKKLSSVGINNSPLREFAKAGLIKMVHQGLRQLAIPALVAASFLSLPVIADAQYGSPQGVTTDPGGNLWMAEASANTVVEISPANGAALRTITAGLNNPVRLAFDSSKNLYVANLVGNNVTVYTSTGTLSRTILGVNRPLGVAVNGADDLFVASNSGNEVYVFNSAGQQIQVLNKDTSGHYFDAPGALAVYGPNLYVAFNDGSVISYNSGNFASGNAVEVTKYVHSGSGGPTAIAFDSGGDVYVSYYYTNDVVEYSPSGTVLTDITSSVSQPEGIAVDGAGTIYVANTAASNTVSVFNATGSKYNAGLLLRQLNGTGGRLVNFDQDTTGKAIANNSAVNTTYAPWGVTFESQPAGASAYAVACPAFAASQPNVISPSQTCYFATSSQSGASTQYGAVQANFSPQVTAVSIQVLQVCIGTDYACLPGWSPAFLAAYNSSGQQIAHMWASEALGIEQSVTVSAPPGETIAFVQFSVQYNSSQRVGWVGGAFDNLSFK